MWSLLLQAFCISTTIRVGIANLRYHRIQEKGNKRCVQMTTVVNNEQAGARSAVVHSCDKTEKDSSTYWEFRSADNAYVLVARHSRKCLKVAKFENSGYIIGGDCRNGDESQLWTVIPSKNTPWVNLKSRQPGNWCLTVYNGLKQVQNGIRTEIYECIGVGNQEFIIIPSLNSNTETNQSVNTELGNEIEDKSGMTTTATALVAYDDYEDLNGDGNINSASSVVVTVTTFYSVCKALFWA